MSVVAHIHNFLNIDKYLVAITGAFYHEKPLRVLFRLKTVVDWMTRNGFYTVYHYKKN